MTNEIRIIKGGRDIPVVAFFGTKGGVGKTTISQRFAELITLAQSAPNVLLIDCDVYHRGMTELLSEHATITIKTVHDYIATKNVSDGEAKDITALVKGVRPDSGLLYFIPASNREASHVYDESAKIGPKRMLEIMHELISKAVEKYDCDCVVIDCPPIIDSYTATAAMLADRAFIIGQNEPISYSSLRTYQNQIRDFFLSFSTSKMKIIINKVRGWERLEERRQTQEIFHAIPFTLDIIDRSEGLSAINDMQIMLFEDHIMQIIEKIFKTDCPQLIPDKQEVLPQEWNSLVENADRLEQSPRIKRFGMLRLFLPVGLLIAIGGCILFIGGSSQRHREERAAQVQELEVILKNEVSKTEASSSKEAEILREALKLAEEVDPNKKKDVNKALEFAKEAGIDEVPTIERQDTSRENAGIGILLGGVLLGSIGLSYSRSRKNYLSAIHGLRKGGTKWMMEEMKTKRSSRKVFDKMLKMSKQSF